MRLYRGAPVIVLLKLWSWNELMCERSWNHLRTTAIPASSSFDTSMALRNALVSIRSGPSSLLAVNVSRACLSLVVAWPMSTQSTAAKASRLTLWFYVGMTFSSPVVFTPAWAGRLTQRRARASSFMAILSREILLHTPGRMSWIKSTRDSGCRYLYLRLFRKNPLRNSIQLDSFSSYCT